MQKLKAKYWNAHTNSNLNSSFISVQSHLHYTKLYHRVLPDVREQKLKHYQVSRGQRNLCCKTKGQPQKYFGNSFHVRGSYVSPGMQVQQYGKRRNFMCWDGQRSCFPLAFLLQSFSGGITCFSRSARIGSTSVLRCCSSHTGISAWPKSYKATLWWVVGTDIMSVLSFQQNPAELLSWLLANSSHQKELKQDTIYLHGMTFWEILIFQHSFLFPKHKS